MTEPSDILGLAHTKGCNDSQRDWSCWSKIVKVILCELRFRSAKARVTTLVRLRRGSWELPTGLLVPDTWISTVCNSKCYTETQMCASAINM